MPKHEGMHTHRLDKNAYEAAAAEMWRKRNDRPNGGDGLLDNILGAHEGRSVTDRDREVAATMMQWLGSLVGQRYLDELTQQFDQIHQRALDEMSDPDKWVEKDGKLFKNQG